MTNKAKPEFVVNPGDIFQDRDKRMHGRRILVREIATKQRDVYRAGRYVKEDSPCVVAEVVGFSPPRIVKIRIDELSKRWNRVEA